VTLYRTLQDVLTVAGRIEAAGMSGPIEADEIMWWEDTAIQLVELQQAAKRFRTMLEDNLTLRLEEPAAAAG
jgi:hypothetical protein